MQPSDLREIAVQIAGKEGAQVRVTSAQGGAATYQRLRLAFARGDFTTWRYDDTYAKTATNPQKILAGARSIVCVAIPYALTRTDAEYVPLTGRVSNYVGAEDYHIRVRTLLSRIARAFDEAAGEVVSAIACDTSPLAERAFAARAGLGWIGKHTNLISPALGSFVFLGEIVTTLAIPVDAPLRKSCGGCTRCVAGCPTGALRGDYTIDATRCISDLTQRKDAIPRHMRALMGTWVWGCDVCQEVCPPTQLVQSRAQIRVRKGAADDQAEDSEAVQPDLLALLRMGPAAFKKKYRKSAMGWRGAAVLRRNAAVALGNALDRSSVLPLVQALQAESNPMVRSHIAWALGRIGSPSARQALRAYAQSENDASVKEEIHHALSM